VQTKEIGDIGEERAKYYLCSLGHKIMAQNYRYKRSEIDIISEKHNIIHFTEVKFRKNSKYGHGETFVSEQKLNMLHIGAEGYISQEDWNGDIQFDIIAITGDQIEHLQDII
jgi:putative endonuclease